MRNWSYCYAYECQAAGGIADKAQPLIEDIDKFDGDNELAVVDYIEEIYKFYKTAEVTTETSVLQISDLLLAVSDNDLHGLLQRESRPLDYIEAQVEINSKMRAILADWIIEVHNKFELMPETLYLTMHIIDQYLSLQPVVRRELQLVGISAMLIACKYEEIWAPEVHRKLQYISALCFSVLIFRILLNRLSTFISGQRFHSDIRQCLQ
jgi:G2/mitotic-specific cyclin-B, other